jgi:uncharacterized protein
MSDFHLSSTGWILAVFTAFFVGLTKGGLGGFGLVAVLLAAQILPNNAMKSTGFLLPMLIFGDIFAVTFFKKHAQWNHIRKLLPPAIVGVVAGYFWMKFISDATFKPLIGGIALVLCIVQWLRMRDENLFAGIPHTKIFTWAMGGLCGVTTMLANAAGPVATVYMLAQNLPKWEFVGTGAWFFLIVNLVKVPFSWDLGLISLVSLKTNILLIPAILCGIALGRAVINKIEQKMFEKILLIFAALAAVRLLFP